MRRLLSRFRKRPFTGSAEYWTRRYGDGRTSGAGSYGRLAEYKAEFINALVAEKGVTSVIEYGSGDGNQASKFDFANYTGVDVVPQVVEAARKRFADRPSWRFLTVAQEAGMDHRFDMSMSLDVIYHLVEDEVFDAYMSRLFATADRYVLIYATDHEEPDTGSAHVRHRRYTDWIAANAPRFGKLRAWDNPHGSAPGTDPKTTSFAFFQLFGREGAA